MGGINDSIKEFKDNLTGITTLIPKDYDEDGRVIHSGESSNDDNQRQHADTPDSVPQEQPEPQREAESNANGGESKSTKGTKEAIRSEKRINQLLYEVKMQEAARLEEQRRYAEEYQRQLKNVKELEENNQLLKNHALEIEKEQTLNGLRAARDAQDIDIEVQLQDRLSQINLAQQKLRDAESSYEREDQYYSQPLMGTYPQYADYQSTQPQEQPFENENFTQWLSKNAWANPNSNEYSPAMEREVFSISEDLDNTLRVEGKYYLKGTPEYFDSLSYAMQQKYGVQAPQQQVVQQPVAPKQQAYTPRPPAGVTPVGRTGSSMAEQYVEQNPHLKDYSSILSKREIDLYRNTVIPIAPGKVLTGDAAVRFHAERKMNYKPNFVHDGRRAQLIID